MRTQVGGRQRVAEDLRAILDDVNRGALQQRAQVRRRGSSAKRAAKKRAVSRPRLAASPRPEHQARRGSFDG
jgi:hypothetical protein